MSKPTTTTTTTPAPEPMPEAPVEGEEGDEGGAQTQGTRWGGPVQPGN